MNLPSSQIAGHLNKAPIKIQSLSLLIGFGSDSSPNSGVFSSFSSFWHSMRRKFLHNNNNQSNGYCIMSFLSPTICSTKSRNIYIILQLLALRWIFQIPVHFADSVCLISSGRHRSVLVTHSPTLGRVRYQPQEGERLSFLWWMMGHVTSSHKEDFKHI